jgi:hypothetical protein
VIHKKRKELFGVITVFIAIILFFGINNFLIYTHKLTPVGEKLVDTRQVQKDVAHIFKDKYKIYFQMETFKIKESLPLRMGKSKEILKRAYKNQNDLLIQLSLTDKRIRGRDIDVYKEGQVIVTNQTIRFLIYFIQREYDPSIKALSAVYTPRNFDLDAVSPANLVIIIDEFKNEYKQLIEDGYEGKELESKLEEKFIYHD